MFQVPETKNTIRKLGSPSLSYVRVNYPFENIVGMHNPVYRYNYTENSLKTTSAIQNESLCQRHNKS